MMESLSPIQVREYGDVGRDVVVLHGGPGAQGSVSGLAKLLSEHFRVYEPLQRRSGTVELTVARHVHDLAEVTPQSFALVGHSFGAMLALSFAARHPQRVTRVLLVGCGTYDATAERKLRENLLDRLGDEGKRQILALKHQLEETEDVTERAKVFRKLGGMFALTEAYELIEETESTRDALPPDVEGYEQTWKDVIRLQTQHIEPELFATIKVPVMLIQGDTDPHPATMTRDLLKRHIPQLEFMLLERCGHEPWRERYAKDTFLETLRIWLNR